MHSLLQSAFLQALGYAIANSLWQMALLWLLYILICGMVSLSAPVKYKLASGAQLLGFGWFLVTFYYYLKQCQEMIYSLNTIQLQTGVAVFVPEADGSFVSQLLQWLVKTEKTLPYLSLAYLCLLVFLAVRWFINYRQTQQLGKVGLQKPDLEIRIFVKKVADYLGIKQPVKVYLSNLVTSPLTFGYLKPIILIPVASINHLTTQQLEAVLLHELAHIRRCDYFFNLLYSAIETILFFNPFTRLLGSYIKRERENSCDDWVLQFQYQPALYAEALLQIAYLESNPTLAMKAVSKKVELLPRVQRMIGDTKTKFDYKQQLLALFLVTCLISLFAWLPLTKQNNNLLISQNKVSQKVVIEPMSAKVKNPLFNPVFFLTKPLQEKVEASVNLANEAMNNVFNTENVKALSIPAIEKINQELASIKEPVSFEENDLNSEIKYALAQTASFTDSIISSRLNETEFKESLKNEFQRSTEELKKNNMNQNAIDQDLKRAFKELKQINLNSITSMALQQVKLAEGKSILEKKRAEIEKAKSITDSIKAEMTKYFRQNNLSIPYSYSFASTPLIEEEEAETIFIKQQQCDTCVAKKIELSIEPSEKGLPVKIIIEKYTHPQPREKKRLKTISL